MPPRRKLPERSKAWSDRYAAWRARRAVALDGFAVVPEPRSFGSFERGQKLVDGQFHFQGEVFEARETAPWDWDLSNTAVERALHGFRWLEDLAAFGNITAKARAQDWTLGWIDAYPTGRGMAWSPDLIALRLRRWVDHSDFLLRRSPQGFEARFFKSIAQQADFLARTWTKVPVGSRYFETLLGLLYIGVFIDATRIDVESVSQTLASGAQSFVDESGGIKSRNPEELLRLFETLVAAKDLLLTVKSPVPDGLSSAIKRIAPVLRALRLADGALARFHGGGRGTEGRVDQALIQSGVRSGVFSGLAMGYQRLSSGRTTLIADSAPPPVGLGSDMAHASTLGFELTTGRRPLLVNCGCGAPFGKRWARASRATVSHCVLSIEGVSSAQLSAGSDAIQSGPTNVPVECMTTEKGMVWEAAHDGYVATHGLTHIRRVELSTDGRSLDGTDTLTTLCDDHKRRYDRVLAENGAQTLGYTLRFHLHPDVEAEVEMGGDRVQLMMKSGERWIFGHDGQFLLRLEPSAYLQKGRTEPRASTQIVLLARSVSYASRIRWSFAKAEDTPVALRDLERDDWDEDGADHEIH